MKVGVVSASSISTTAATTGCHVLKINGYSDLKMVVSNGSPATSCEFEAAGHTWYIRYYPNGASSNSADHISLYLRLADRDAGAVNAKFRFSLLAPHGGGNPPPPPYGKSLRAEFCTPASISRGFPFFVKREVLERSGYLRDDCFAVRCDIDVVRMSSAPDATVEDHDLHRLGLPCRSCQEGQCTVEETPPQRHRWPVMAAWFRRLFGCGKIKVSPAVVHRCDRLEQH